MKSMTLIPGYKEKDFDWETAIEKLYVGRKTKEMVRDDCLEYRAELGRIMDKVIRDISEGGGEDLSDVREKFDILFDRLGESLDAGVMQKDVRELYRKMQNEDRMRVREYFELIEEDYDRVLSAKYGVMRTNNILAEIMRKVRIGKVSEVEFKKAFESAIREVKKNNGYNQEERTEYACRRVGRVVAMTVQYVLKQKGYKDAAKFLNMNAGFIPGAVKNEIEREIERAQVVNECVKKIMSSALAEAEAYYLAQPIAVQRAVAEELRGLEERDGSLDDGADRYAGENKW